MSMCGWNTVFAVQRAIKSKVLYYESQKASVFYMDYSDFSITNALYKVRE